jgi:hypothetical protein
MFSLFHAVVFIISLQTVSTLQCYSSDPGSPQPVMINSANHTDVCGNTTVCNCISFRAVCTDRNYCTAAEIANNVTKLFYGLIDQVACAGYAAQGVSNLTCCATDMCNNQGLTGQIGTSTPSRLTSMQYADTTSSYSSNATTPSRLTSMQYADTTSNYSSNATTVSLSLSTSTSSSLSVSFLLVLTVALPFIWVFQNCSMTCSMHGNFPFE